MTLLRSIVAVWMMVAALSAAERAWQKGTWQDVKIDRPKISFGVRTRTPGGGLPAPSAKETRTYVIVTGDQRFEVRQDTTIDAPQVEATIGEAVTFAVDKKTVYVKGEDGKEHRFSLVRLSSLAPAQAK